MQVQFQNKPLLLDRSAVLGAGGEATVFALDATRIAKVWHQADPRRARKVAAIMARSWPSEILAPVDVLLDAVSGEIVGCVGPRAPGRFAPLSSLFSLKARAAGVTVADIVQVLSSLSTVLDGLHRSGVVVGDLSDENELFSAGEVRFIDVDSFQIGGEPCAVATEDYVDPSLYGVDLSARPVFAPEHDRYALAVLAFRALLLVHPYGGTHPSFTTIPARASERLWVLRDDVRYPIKVALPPDVLSPALLDYFESVFVGGERGPLPTKELFSHAAAVVRCDRCGLEAPGLLAECPACRKKGQAIPVRIQRGCVGDKILAADGPITFLEIAGERVFAVAIEGGRFVLHVLGGGARSRTDLGPAASGDRFALLSGGLFAHASGDRITLLDPARGTVLVTSTATYDGAPVMAAMGDRLVRIAGSLVMAGEVRRGALVERALTTALSGQTTVFASPARPDVLLGIDRIFSRIVPFRVANGERRDLPVTALARDEALLGLSLLGDGGSTLLLRLVRQGGVHHTRLDLVDARCSLAAASRTRSDESPVRASIEGRTFRGLSVLHPTDDGIVRETLRHGTVGTLSPIDGSEPFVSRASLVVPHPRGLLVTDAGDLFLLTQR
jgi:hypothetical protein